MYSVIDDNDAMMLMLMIMIMIMMMTIDDDDNHDIKDDRYDHQALISNSC